MNCAYRQQVQAYHDRQLPPRQLAVLEEHLQDCGECRRELAELRALARLLRSARVPALSAAALQRLHEGVQGVTDRGILRFTEILTGVAAAILLVGLIGLSAVKPSRERPQAAWEQLATSGSAETTQMADLYMVGYFPRVTDD